MALSVTPLWAAAFGCNVEKQYHCARSTLLLKAPLGTKYAVHRQTNEIACTNRRYVTRADQGKFVRILLYNPDNGVTRNFMPHLWMFLLEALTPSGHEVLLIDGTRSRWMKPASLGT